MRLYLLAVIAACRFDPGAADPATPLDGRTADASADARLEPPSDTLDAPPPYCDPGDPTLIACYEFEHTLADGTSHHLDPDVMDHVTYVTGAVGSALYASSATGSATEVDVAENSIFGVAQVTIEAWINPTAIPSVRGGILDCDGRYGFFLYADDTVHCIAGGVAAMAGPISTGVWTHVACTMDGSMTHAYVNGKLVMSVAVTGPLSPTGSQTGITLGGNNPPNGGDPLGGGLDEVRLFGSARTAAQICADSGSAGCP